MSEIVETAGKSPIARSAAAARKALAAMREAIDDAATIQALREIERRAKAIRAYYGDVVDVRREAEETIVLANHRAGCELVNAPVAPAGRPKKSRPGVTQFPAVPSLRALVGSQTRGKRLKKLAEHDRGEVLSAVAAIHAEDREATVSAILKLFAGDETKARREQSRAAAPIPDGMDLRIGDARRVLADVPDNSVPLILTDPPYGDDAEPLYVWLARFASRVLIPGGSLICYTGQSRLNRDIAILDQWLRYWWLLVMPHDQAQRLPGKFVIANFKPVLWYVKDHRRGRSLVPDMLISPKRDKSEHNWGQGDGGIGPLIEHLTEPGELVVDPFAGTANWGRRATAMGRRWIGADVVAGGDTIAAAD